MKLAEIINALRIELQDEDATTFSEGELERCITKTVSLMSRLIPKRCVIEKTYPNNVTAESLVIASGKATTTYKPIKYASEVITKSGVTYVRGTNYSIDYTTGIVTVITDMDDETYSIAYSLDSSALDISDIATKLITIDRLEYPVGDSPSSYPTFNLIGDILFLSGSDSFSAGKHLRISYNGVYDPPSEQLEGTYPQHLDEAVIIGACASALLAKARYYLYQAAKVAVESDTETASSTVDITAALAALAKVGDCLDLAEGYLASGDGLINAVTAGQDVGATYATYANQECGIASQYISEATALLNAATAKMTKSQRKESETQNYLSVVQKMMDDANIKFNEFYAMIGVRVEIVSASMGSSQRD